MNYNVRLSLWWTIAENISGSIRSGDGLSAYLYLLTKNNATVGFIQGINGILQLLVALPAGWLADRTRRDTVLRAGAAVGLAGGGALAYAVGISGKAWAVGLAMALLGAYRGFYNPALEALFADSVESGRSSPYTWRYVVMILSSAAGPLLSLIVFLHLGDNWTLKDCRIVVLVGLVLMVPALALMCFFDDEKALGGHHHDGGNTEAENAEQSPRDDTTSTNSLTQPLLQAETGNIDAEYGMDSSIELERQHGEQHCRTDVAMAAADRTFWPLSPALAVPLLLTTSDIFGALASGMTLKFFPLFFMQRAGLSPVFVSLISAAAPTGVAAASIAAQRGSKIIGRVQISLITRLVDIILLICMAYLPATPGKLRNLLVAVHLLRMSAANCTRPLMRSVLNQFVPKRHRGKVNAVDSVRTFSWSGSAALGGILVERFGFEYTFLITAAVKVASFVPLLFLISYVPDGVLAGGRVCAAEEAVSAAEVLVVAVEEESVRMEDAPPQKRKEVLEESNGGRDGRANGVVNNP